MKRELRNAAVGLVVLAACTDVQYFTPVVRGVARSDGSLAKLPMAVCDTPAVFQDPVSHLYVPQPPSIVVRGSGFVPELVDATGAGVQVPPSVTLEGPSTYNAPAGVRSSDWLDASIVHPSWAATPTSQTPARLTDGLYSVVVADPEETLYGVPAHSRLDGAVQILPPPSVTSISPQPVCLASGATVVFRGGPFSPNIRISMGGNWLPDSAIRFDAPDQLTVAFAATASSASMTAMLVFDDGGGCAVQVLMQVACP
jgi:hypothetical protein